MRQIPCQVPADDHVERIIGEIQLFRIHLQEADLFRESSGISPGFIQHGGCQIDCCDTKTHFRQKDRKKAGTCPDIQNIQLLMGSVREMVHDLIFQTEFPFLSLFCGQFCPVDFGITGRPSGPVLSVFGENR